MASKSNLESDLESRAWPGSKLGTVPRSTLKVETKSGMYAFYIHAGATMGGKLKGSAYNLQLSQWKKTCQDPQVLQELLEEEEEKFTRCINTYMISRDFL
ncbi:hypothetical protein EVAR_28400_1 [Eumeta japonica]|uniref:Uncharacterized protein n=1 Tax=Eumeta variegata TaxID=151549 RepID=A0A4C1XBC6_EUMVA|nr:hypothetical protein EVAR_28400_1 [Eumeta japonica]